MEGDPQGCAEKDFNHWMAVVENHPETRKKNEAEEAAYIAKCQESLAIIRGVVPPNIVNGLDKKSLVAKGRNNTVTFVRTRT